jgi:hypothetical protein
MKDFASVLITCDGVGKESKQAALEEIMQEHTALRSALSNLLHSYQATSTATGVTHAEKHAEDVLFQTRTN